MIDVALKCTACRNKSNYCDCEEPSLVWDTFAILLAKQDSTPLYVTIKDFDLLCSILDVTSAEVDMTMDYVRRYGEFKVFNETLKSKSFEMKRVFSFFNKITCKKAVYGTFAAKKDKVKGMDDNIVPDYVRGESSQMDASNYLFANGSLKQALAPGSRQGDNKQTHSSNNQGFVLTYHLLAQHCERVAPSSISNLLFKSIFSKL